MERITKRSPAGMAEYDFPASCFFPDGTGDPIAVSAFCQSGLDRLSAYEDTGLAPEEIKAALATNDTARVFVEKMTEFGGTEAVKRLRELAEADRDGRVVVLPCKVGDTVYFVLKDSPQFYPDTNGWYIGESKVLTVTDKGFCDGEVGGDCITPWDELGRTVFLTREEAEQALKEAKEDG